MAITAILAIFGVALAPVDIAIYFLSSALPPANTQQNTVADDLTDEFEQQTVT